MDIFCNSNLLTNIRRINKSIIIQKNNSEMLVNTVGYFHVYGWVWY